MKCINYKQVVINIFSIIVLSLCGIKTASAYDFSATATTGQELYYKILSDSTVAVTYPNHVGISYYSGYTMPSGNVLIPSHVEYSATTYKVVSIASYAFYNCSGLQELVIPNTVTTIESNACQSCAGLASVILSNSLISIGDNAFKGCSSLVDVSIPNSVIGIGVGAFQSCVGITNVSLGTGVLSIGNLAFEGCQGITSITIPNSVFMLGNWAFCNCSGLTSLTLGESLSLIQQNSFAGCANVQTINFLCRNANISHAGNVSALPLNNLTTLVVGDSVQVLSQYAFSNASHLKHVYLGCSLAEIGDFVFDNCDSISNLEVRRLVPPTIYSNTFSSYGFQLSIPCSSVFDYNAASYWTQCDSIVTIFPYQLKLVVNDSLFGEVQILQNASCSNNYAQFQAEANMGYHFLRWSDGDIQNPRQLPVNSDIRLSAIFVSNYSTISVLSADTTKGLVSGGGLYYYHDTVSLVAYPNVGYHFQSWSDGQTDNPRVFSAIQDTSYTAYFEIDEYRLNVQPSDSVCGSVAGSGTFTYLEESQIEAIPNYGYYFSTWSDGDTMNPRIISMASDTTIIAYFLPSQYQVIASSNDTLLGNVSGYGTYSYLSAATILATPGEHAYFLSWNDGNTDNPRSINITSDTSLTAFFAPILYQLAAIVDDSIGFVSGIGAYPYATSVMLEAVPNAHYHFVRWTDGQSTNPRTVTIMNDTTISPIFEINQTYQIVVSSNDDALGHVSGGGSYYYADTAVIFAQAQGEHVEFYYWSDGCTDNPRYVPVISDAEYTAVFGTERATLELTANDDYAGKLYGAGRYSYGSVVTFQAVPYPYYEFVKWADGVTDNPRTITIISDTALQAIFRNIYDNLGVDEIDQCPYSIVLNHRTLQVSSHNNALISIFDVNGRNLVKSAPGSVAVQVPSAGVYFVKVGGSPVQKILIN